MGEAHEKFWENLHRMLQKYVTAARRELEARWRASQIDIVHHEASEVVGGLLARQVTLAIQMATNPGIWNPHIAPIVLRSMVEAQIVLIWILKDANVRSRKFIEYGLGQQKLELEHLKAAANEHDEEAKKMLESLTELLNAERYHWLTEVNVGNWAGSSLRKMAEEADCLDIYTHVYTPFSAAVHNMWHHVYRFNLVRCTNPLHGAHRVPAVPELQSSLHFFQLAAKYLRETFDLFDNVTGVGVAEPSAYTLFGELLAEYRSKGESKSEAS